MRALILSLALVALPAHSHVVVVKRPAKTLIHLCSFVIAGFAPPVGPGILEGTCEGTFNAGRGRSSGTGPWNVFINKTEYRSCRLEAATTVSGQFYYQFSCP